MSRAGVMVTRISRKRGLMYVVLITLILALGFGIIYGLIEDTGSVFDGIWRALVTITTVGYGDFFPLTTAGRIVAGLLMLVGIGFVATLTATVAAHFMDDQEDELRNEMSTASPQRSDEPRASGCGPVLAVIASACKKGLGEAPAPTRISKRPAPTT